jgi:hypothetical protein
MSNKKLAILGVVAIVMVLWAIVQSKVSNKSRTAPDSPSYLIQGLDPSDIDSIIINSAENAVTLKRAARGFVVVNKDNYPADTSEINTLLTKCLEIETTQFITDNPANYEDLEITEEKAKMVVKFLKSDSSLLTGLIVGKDKELGQGTYVRLASSDKVYVASSIPWFGDIAMNYIKRELFSLDSEEIESVTVSLLSGTYILKAKENSEDIELVNIPAGKTFKSTEGRTVFTALTNVSFNDVRKKTDDLNFDRHYVCRLKDSTEYAIGIAAEDDKTFITCGAEFTNERPSRVGKDESEEELKIKEAMMLADDKAREFTAKHQGWVYEIAEYKAEHLKKELEDLIEDEIPIEEVEDPNAIPSGEISEE